jgi:predicted RNA-binding protein Jag
MLMSETTQALPEGTVTAEGRTVRDAVLKAAEALGVAPNLVEHKLDTSHFRTPDGRVRPVDTVKILARAKDPGDVEGAEAAKAWIEQLLGLMEIEGTVRYRTGNGKSADLLIDSPRARHLVGRRGVTLRAIRRLMEAALHAEHGEWTFDLNVEGGRRRDERDERDERDDDRRGRGRDRDDRRGRDRDDDRRGRDRDDDRRGRRRERGDRDDRRSERDVKKLKRLARRLAEEAIEKGEVVRIRKELNSYERRVVHLVVAELDGVSSESEGDGAYKRIVLVPDGAEE